jgi:16S rRNA (adenine1518-N6/adenine1519-N6)-dimethyltransferase
MIKAKKHLGQHFLTDKTIAQRIVDSLSDTSSNLIEIGPGTGILTDFIISNNNNFYAIDIDSESIEYLRGKYSEYSERIILADFLKTDLTNLFSSTYSIIGNFPYNISSQIFFKLLEHRDKVDEIVCMLQKEVAERIASSAGNKTYGILSVLLQTFYNIEYLFTVKPGSFNPPPKVNSAVIRLRRNERKNLPVPEKLYFRIIKESFNKRRKVLSNSLKPILLNLKPENDIFSKRPEQLGVEEFIYLSTIIHKENNHEV